MTAPTLLIRDLRLGFRGYSGLVEVLHGISLHVAKGERVALVGESGSGKSVTARIVLGLLQILKSARISGRVAFEGRDLSRLSGREANFASRRTAGRDDIRQRTQREVPAIRHGKRHTEGPKRKLTIIANGQGDSAVRTETDTPRIHRRNPAREHRTFTVLNRNFWSFSIPEHGPVIVSPADLRGAVEKSIAAFDQ